MNHLLDFLPPSFVRDQQRRSRVARQWAMIAVLALGMIGWHFMARARLDGLGRYAASVQAEAAAVRRQASEVIKLRGRHESLTKQVRIQRELEEPLTYTQALATIGALMPQQVSLRSLSIDSPPPTPTADKTAAAPEGGARRGRSASGAPGNRLPVMHLEVVALSPEDPAIADFIAALTEHPIFDGVKVLYSRTVRLRGIPAREFKLLLDVPLDRDYRPSAEGKGVARAD